MLEGINFTLENPLGLDPLMQAFFIKINRMIIRHSHHLCGHVYSICFSKQDTAFN